MLTDDIVWVITVSDQPSGSDLVSVKDAGEENPARPRVVENRTPYGHGGNLPSGTAIAISRCDDGGMGFAAYIPTPSWATAVGDVWSATVGGIGIRLSDNASMLELHGGTGILQYVARDGDPVNAATNFAAWVSTVSAHVGCTPPTDLGTIAASSTNVEST